MAVVVVVAGLLIGSGWLYVLRSLGWLGWGPHIGNALPLLQLARSDGQPLARVVVAWLPAGVLAGTVVAGWSRVRRVGMTGQVGVVLLLVGAQAASALTRGGGFISVLFSRPPGPGPLVEALIFAVGSGLPRTRARTSGYARTAARRPADRSMIGA